MLAFYDHSGQAVEIERAAFVGFIEHLPVSFQNIVTVTVKTHSDFMTFDWLVISLAISLWQDQENVRNGASYRLQLHYSNGEWWDVLFPASALRPGVCSVWRLAEVCTSELVIKLRRTPVGIWNSLVKHNRRQGKTDLRSPQFRCINWASIESCLAECDNSDKALIFIQATKGFASSNKLYKLFAVFEESVSSGDKCIRKK